MQETSIRKSLTATQWDRIFYGCPGAWAGNKPEPNQAGTVVIDGGKVSEVVWTYDNIPFGIGPVIY